MGRRSPGHRGPARRSAKIVEGGAGVFRFVNRPLGRQLAALAFRHGRSRNQVTLISGAFTFAAIAIIGLVSPSWPLGVLIAALLVIGYALDAADGQLARLSGRSSYAGEWLDHMVDAAKICSLHLAVLINLQRFTELAGTAWLLVPIGYAIVGSVLFFGMTLNDQLRRHRAVRTGVAAPSGRSSALRSLLVIPTDYGLLCLIFVLFGSTTVFISAYAVMMVGTAGYLVLACVKWFREFAQLDNDTVA